MKVEFTFKSHSCLDAYIDWTFSGVDSIGLYMSFPSFVWSGASLGRAFLSQTAKLRRRRLIFARRDLDALCFLSACSALSFILVRLTCASLDFLCAISEVVQSSRSRVANALVGTPSKQLTQANSNTLVTPFARDLAGRPHPSGCHPTIHTASCVEARQTAQNSPCNQRHQHTTPHLPGIADLQLRYRAFLLASIPALV